jgi:hypothetical protein
MSSARARQVKELFTNYFCNSLKWINKKHCIHFLFL